MLQCPATVSYFVYLEYKKKLTKTAATNLFSSRRRPGSSSVVLQSCLEQSLLVSVTASSLSYTSGLFIHEGSGLEMGSSDTLRPNENVFYWRDEQEVGVSFYLTRGCSMRTVTRIDTLLRLYIFVTVLIMSRVAKLWELSKLETFQRNWRKRTA